LVVPAAAAHPKQFTLLRQAQLGMRADQLAPLPERKAPYFF
jgi:hypothetical protein